MVMIPIGATRGSCGVYVGEYWPRGLRRGRQTEGEEANPTRLSELSDGSDGSADSTDAEAAGSGNEHGRQQFPSNSLSFNWRDYAATEDRDTPPAEESL
jgi:hypothetical protein